MDIEFHYYITYVLAEKAGFAKDESAVIAYACQHTDDNSCQYYVNFKDSDEGYLSKVSQTMDITKPSWKQQRIYPYFHFFPGDPASPTAERTDGRTHPFNTTPDSGNVKIVFRDALESGNLFRIGIAAHVYADTWAHQNFLGLEHDFNATPDLMGKFTPNIGHADAHTNPDKVDHRWTDNRLVETNERVDNNDRFLRAAERIFMAFSKHRRPEKGEQSIAAEWEELKGQLGYAMNAGGLPGPLPDSDQKERIAAYEKIVRHIPEYDEKKWRHDALEKRDLELDIFDKYWAKEGFFESNWYKFQEAAKAHVAASRKQLAHLYGKP